MNPGQSVKLHAAYSVWNHESNTCINQKVILLDTTIVCKLYNGVPCRGVTRTTDFDITAPQKEGVYLLWQSGDLQYSMADAVKRIQTRDCNAAEFLGFVEVKNHFKKSVLLEAEKKKEIVLKKKTSICCCF